MLTNVRIEDQILTVQYDNSSPDSPAAREFWLSQPLLWWRDHCQCHECHHEDTKQRQLDTFSLPEEIETMEVFIDDNKQLVIFWGNKWNLNQRHVSVYDLDFIKSVRPFPAQLEIERTLWNNNTIEIKTPFVEYDAFMTSDTILLHFLQLVERYGFCFVENTPATKEGTIAVSERVAYIRQTIFGGYYEMTANLEHKDTAYTPLAIGPHTDGTYSNDAPSYQVLHCLEENCVGGENILVDGFKIAQIMSEKYFEDFMMLTRIQVPGQYIDTEKGIHLMAQRPVFRLGDDQTVLQVSYNNHDRAPFELNVREMVAFYRALATFARLCAKPEFHYRRKLQPGSCLFFDNWRILHARDAYTGYRKLAGAYFNKEDVESKLRVLRNAT